MNHKSERIKSVLREYWESEIRKEQISQDTLSMNPELCFYLDELEAEDTLTEFQLETYKEVTLLRGELQK